VSNAAEWTTEFAFFAVAVLLPVRSSTKPGVILSEVAHRTL
jgi:hypothetical protein